MTNLSSKRYRGESPELCSKMHAPHEAVSRSIASRNQRRYALGRAVAFLTEGLLGCLPSIRFSLPISCSPIRRILQADTMAAAPIWHIETQARVRLEATIRWNHQCGFGDSITISNIWPDTAPNLCCIGNHHAFRAGWLTDSYYWPNSLFQIDLFQTTAGGITCFLATTAQQNQTQHSAGNVLLLPGGSIYGVNNDPRRSRGEQWSGSGPVPYIALILPQNTRWVYKSSQNLSRVVPVIPPQITQPPMPDDTMPKKGGPGPGQGGSQSIPQTQTAKGQN